MLTNNYNMAADAESVDQWKKKKHVRNPKSGYEPMAEMSRLHRVTGAVL